jgi:hypothetical protein
MLTVEGVSAAEVARLAGVHRSSAMRHGRNHLLPTIADAVQAEFDVVAEVRDVYARARRFLTAAEGTNNWPAARAFIGECRSSLELLGKLLIATELSKPRGPLEITVDISASDGPELVSTAREIVPAFSVDEEPDVDPADDAALI